MTEAPSLPATWRKSTFSGSGECVEVADLGNDWIAMRDSKHPDGDQAVFPRNEIRAFVRGIVAGEFDDLC